MTDDGTDALEQALALHASPGRLSRLRGRSLPNAVLLLIRIAAGDAEAVSNASARTGEPEQVVFDAAVLYVQQVLFHEAADSYRLLGVSSGAPADTIKEHYRWLMRWLHPDRHPDRWEAVYSERVNRAWNSLNTERRRLDYDGKAQALMVADGVDLEPPVESVFLPRGARSHPMMSPRVIRRLPVVVLGGLACFAMLSLVLLAWTQRDQDALAQDAVAKLDQHSVDDAANAQQDAIRRRMAFEERVIALSQPVQPENSAAEKQRIANDIARASAAQAIHATAVLTPAQSPISMLPSAAPTHPVATATAVSVALPSPAVARAPTTQSSRVIPAEHEPAVSRPLAAPASAVTPPSSIRPVSTQSMAATPTRIPTSPTPAPVRKIAVHTNPVVLASTDSVVVAPAGVTAQSAVMLVPHEFEDAYANGDIARMMNLFSSDAVNNRGGIEAIRQDYDHLFHNSSARELRLDALAWVVQSDRIVGTGSFEAHIRHTDGSAAELVRGWIRIEAVPVAGNWKIRRLTHRTGE